MRYISKVSEPDFIKEFKDIQRRAGLPATYDSFGGKGNKSALNDILRESQHNICCYCQRRIDHYLGEKNTGAHNEHLYPQDKDPGDGSVDLDFENIFACCIASKGFKKKSQHCGEAKGNQVILGSIRNPDCEIRFKYNLIGEILPAGDYDVWKDYLTDYSHLPPMIQQIVDEIRTLNLNCNSLVNDRRNIIETIVGWAIDTPREDVAQWLNSFENTDDEFPIFYSMIKYILRNL